LYSRWVSYRKLLVTTCGGATKFLGNHASFAVYKFDNAAFDRLNLIWSTESIRIMARVGDRSFPTLQLWIFICGFL
jgi:hypothetical protein